MEQNRFTRSPAATAVQLVLWSVVVGVVLSALGITPYNIIDRIGLIIRNIYNLGFDALNWAVQYFLLGAIIVVPIWLISRFMGNRRG